MKQIVILVIISALLSAIVLANQAVDTTLSLSKAQGYNDNCITVESAGTATKFGPCIICYDWTGTFVPANLLQECEIRIAGRQYYTSLASAHGTYAGGNYEQMLDDSRTTMAVTAVAEDNSSFTGTIQVDVEVTPTSKGIVQIQGITVDEVSKKLSALETWKASAESAIAAIQSQLETIAQWLFFWQYPGNVCDAIAGECTQPSPRYCSDNDGGKLFSQKGVMTTQSATYEDVCHSDTVLEEHYCTDAFILQIQTKRYTIALVELDNANKFVKFKDLDTGDGFQVSTVAGQGTWYLDGHAIEITADFAKGTVTIPDSQTETAGISMLYICPGKCNDGVCVECLSGADCNGGNCVNNVCQQATGTCTFRTNAIAGNYASGTWIAVDTNNDGTLEGFGYSGTFGAAYSCRGTTIAQTPEGYNVTIESGKLYVCVPFDSKYVSKKYLESSATAVTSTSQTQPFTANNQEVCQGGTIQNSQSEQETGGEIGVHVTGDIVDGS
ncbi:MAG: hypothetical protein ABIF10_00015 [Candidatus Woesearchaeota archaeon]